MKKAHIVERHHSALYYYGNKVFWNYIIFLCILRVLWKLYFSCSAVGSVVTFGTATPKGDSSEPGIYMHFFHEVLCTGYSS